MSLHFNKVSIVKSVNHYTKKVNQFRYVHVEKCLIFLSKHSRPSKITNLTIQKFIIKTGRHFFIC